MTWNFPENVFEKMKAMEAYINQLKTEIEQLKKNQPPTPENVLGAFGGGPLTASFNELPFDPQTPGSGGGSGEQEKCFVFATTISTVTKSTTATYSVTLIPSGATLSGVYSFFGNVAAGKRVALAKDIDSDVWGIIAAECG